MEELIIIALKDEFKHKLIEITKQTEKINKNTSQKILEMIQEHVYEIECLYKEYNDHWAIETADLIILCYELLITEDRDIDDVFKRSLQRFDIKLKRLVKDVDRGRIQST